MKLIYIYVCIYILCQFVSVENFSLSQEENWLANTSTRSTTSSELSNQQCCSKSLSQVSTKLYSYRGVSNSVE